MERLNSLKTMALMLTAILLVEVGFLVLQLKPHSFVLWLTLGVIAIVGIILVRMVLSLIKELKDKPDSK